jgi:exonuclease SbcC
MKPISLTLNNFGPFAEEQEIRFDNLEEIFLISGPTGSGKTTIFDGMLYALYGSPAGTRSEDDIKSNFMGETGETAVVFEFAVKGVRYKIERKIKVRINRNGMSVTERSQAIYIRKENTYVPVDETGTLTRLNEYITGLLHLSKDEFSKIIILPQGEFQKFLEEESRGREKILQKLFPTQEHFTVTEFFKQKKKRIADDIKVKESQIDEIEKEFNPETYKEEHKSLDEKLKRLEDDKKKKNDLNDQLVARKQKEESISEEFNELNKRKERLKELNSEKNNVDKEEEKKKRGEEAAKLKPDLDRQGELSLAARETEKKISALQKTETRLIDEQKKISERVKGKGELEKKQGMLEREKGELTPLVEKEGELGRKSNELKDVTDQYKKHSDEQVAAEKNLKELKREIEEERKRISLIEDEIKDQADLIHRYNTIKEKIKLFNDYQEALKNNKQLAKDLKIAETSLKLNKSRLDELKMKKEKSVASNLAASLADKEPCPVCGSTEHPDPANLKEEPFTEDEILLTCESNYENSLSDKNRLAGKMEDSNKQVKKYKTEIDREGIDLSKDGPLLEKERKDTEEKIKKNRERAKEVEELKKSISENEEKEKKNSKGLEELGKLVMEKGNQKTKLETEVENLTDDLKGQENIKTIIEGIEQQVTEIRNEIETIHSEEKRIRDEITRNTTEIGESKSRLKDEKKVLGEVEHRLQAEIKKRGFSSHGEISDAYLTEEEIDDIGKRIKEYNDNLVKINSGIEDLEKKLTGVKKPNIESTMALLEKNHGELEQIEAKLKETGTELSHLEKKNRDHSKLNKELEKIIKNSQALFELADDLSGQNPRKVNFQNYILNYYLTRVTTYANNRLKVLSDSRYYLHVDDAVMDRRSQAGLELHVMDSYTGQSRSVKTLSGGEKFLASISLALGLSDAIQERAGQIEMDSLFLDEGFGTLDDESLNRAISILDDIRENRMVGVISHVSELKKRIPCQIKVEKTNQGSRIVMP